MVKSKSSISVFFPCFNDEKTIGNLVKDAFVTLSKLSKNYEVIVVNDGSVDRSPAVLSSLKNEYPKLKIVTHKKNRGYGGALKSGFIASRKELVFYTDGDGQYDVKELPLLVTLMTKDVNFVNGIKMERQDYVYRVILGNLYAFLIRWIFLLPIYDVDCDFRLIRRSLLKKIKLNSNSGAVCVELVKKAQLVNAKFRQISIHHYPRKYGTSQFFRLDRILKTYLELAKLWWKIMVTGLRPLRSEIVSH